MPDLTRLPWSDLLKLQNKVRRETWGSFKPEDVKLKDAVAAEIERRMEERKYEPE